LLPFASTPQERTHAISSGSDDALKGNLFKGKVDALRVDESAGSLRLDIKLKRVYFPDAGIGQISADFERGRFVNEI